jgi:ketosteroid isomerase-like protein
MSIKSFPVGVIGFVLSVATAWAGSSAIQGVVKDAKGQGIKGADVRIESRDGKQLFRTVKTDANGRYVSGTLAAGTYRVTLIVNGTLKASAMNTQTIGDRPKQLNFDLRPTSQAGKAAKSEKHMIWVPARSDDEWKVAFEKACGRDAARLFYRYVDRERTG